MALKVLSPHIYDFNRGTQPHSGELRRCGSLPLFPRPPVSPVQRPATCSLTSSSFIYQKAPASWFQANDFDGPPEAEGKSNTLEKTSKTAQESLGAGLEEMSCPPKPIEAEEKSNTLEKTSKIAQGSLGAGLEEMSCSPEPIEAECKRALLKNKLNMIVESVTGSLKDLEPVKYADEIKGIEKIDLNAVLTGKYSNDHAKDIRTAVVDICIKIATCCKLDHIEPWITDLSDLSEKERELISSKDIMLAMITFDPDFINFAPKELITNKKFILDAVARNGMVLKNIPEWQHDYNVVLTAVMQNGYAISHASEKLSHNVMLGTAAVLQCNDAISFLPETLKKNKDILKAAGCMAGLLPTFSHKSALAHRIRA